MRKSPFYGLVGYGDLVMPKVGDFLISYVHIVDWNGGDSCGEKRLGPARGKRRLKWKSTIYIRRGAQKAKLLGHLLICVLEGARTATTTSNPATARHRRATACR